MKHGFAIPGLRIARVAFHYVFMKKQAGFVARLLAIRLSFS